MAPRHQVGGKRDSAQASVRLMNASAVAGETARFPTSEDAWAQSSDPIRADSPRWSVNRRRLASRLAKRTFDVVFATIALVLSVPVIVIAAITIRLESPGPAFFLQERMGQGGRRFRLLKLRGMYIDAHQRFPELYDYRRIDSRSRANYFFHREADPRVTRVGRLLRKFSIDELPNFWNVLRGDMSVVGPRPEIPDLARIYGDDLTKFLSVRPGVTSPAKARGRDALSMDETIALELVYIERHSFWLDLVTIARTAACVLRGGGVL